MKIQRFDRQAHEAIVASLKDALKGVAEKHGIVMTPGKGMLGIDGTTYTIKIDCGLLVNGVAITKEAEAFKRYSHFHGIPASALNQEFTLRGTKYRLVGYLPKSTKRPFLATCNGKQYCIGAEMLREAFPAASPNGGLTPT